MKEQEQIITSLCYANTEAHLVQKVLKDMYTNHISDPCVDDCAIQIILHLVSSVHRVEESATLTHALCILLRSQAIISIYYTFACHTGIWARAAFQRAIKRLTGDGHLSTLRLVGHRIGESAFRYVSDRTSRHFLPSNVLLGDLASVADNIARTIARPSIVTAIMTGLWLRVREWERESREPWPQTNTVIL
ncbi:hypothetical protein FRC02_006890, partial [Tulasnella sp. 418]